MLPRPFSLLLSLRMRGCKTYSSSFPSPLGRGAGVRALFFTLLCCTSSAQAWHALPPGTEGWHEAGRPGIRGITVGPIESSQWPGRGYGTPYSAALLDELARMGTNWISITPFGRLWSLT